jgi:hypothetical protein
MNARPGLGHWLEGGWRRSRVWGSFSRRRKKMRSTWADSEDYSDRRRRSSAKSAATALVIFLALVLAGAAIYWLATRPLPDTAINDVADPINDVDPPTPGSSPKPEPEPRPEPIDDSLLRAPDPTCIEGRPTTRSIPADQCI